MTILKTKIGVAVLAFFTSLIIYFLLALIGGYLALDIKLVAGCIIYFILCYLVLSNQKFPNKIFAFFLVAWFPFFAFIFTTFHFKSTWVSFWSSLFICLGAIGGVLFYKKRNVAIPLFLFLLIPAWFAFVKKPFHNKMVYGTYNGTVLFNQPAIAIYDSTSTVYKLNNSDKFYILDFWTSHCGVCFRKFPIVDSISKVADKSQFEIIALNIPIWEEKKENNYKILDSYPYTFKKLYTEMQSAADSFGVTAFPTTIVVKSGKVIFRGDFEDAVEKYGVMK